jgi:hypothetical protein
MYKTTLREKAILDLLHEGKRTGENAVFLNAQLRGLSDSNLFALYINIFGHAVGENEVLSQEVK